MGTCIGEHNMRFFIAFLAFAGLGITFVVASSFHYLHQLGCFSSGEPWTQQIEPIAIMVVLFCCPPVVPGIGVACGSPGLFCAGLVYGGMMLADTEMRDETGEGRKIKDKRTFLLN